MKRVLIVGDSYMKPDPRFRNQHFSEMLGSVETVILSQDGSSMGMILDQIVQGLAIEPDAVIIGFTAPDRMEYLRRTGIGSKWIASGSIAAMTPEQKEIDRLWVIENDIQMNDIKSHAMAGGIMTMLSHLDTPFVWTANLMYNNGACSYYTVLESFLAPFQHRKNPIEFGRYREWVDKPGFHVNDPEWQQRFAKECRQMLNLDG